MNTTPFRYRLLLLLLSPWLVGTLLLQAWQGRDRKFAAQRLGFGYTRHADHPVWIHCASVGEANAALPLIKKLLLAFPECCIVVSTTTRTGAETVAGWKLENVHHQYLPLDFRFAVNRMIASIRPSVLIVMETEIWPSLFNLSADESIPVILVNGRLSDKTLKSPAWMHAVFKQALSRVAKIFAKSEKDKQGFQQLGAAPGKIEVVGNIKFSSLPATSTAVSEINRPYWLLASTHEDEEEQLCCLLADFPAVAERLMVIAPRHPVRSKSIETALKRCGLNVAVRSRADAILPTTQVYLADQLGEMAQWLSAAEAVFMGGSLVPVGGHNLLEPAMAGVPIVTGPYLHNFNDEAELLNSSGAMLRCDSAREVMQSINILLTDTEKHHAMSEAGPAALSGCGDIADRYAEAVLPFISIKKQLPA